MFTKIQWIAYVIVAVVILIVGYLLNHVAGNMLVAELMILGCMAGAFKIYNGKK
ncbi:hypothetical protein [Listeria sp. PSOL-1]|uniref:hypothetical protein n=1 Tax=Listeria sp. PSOL-1 TaxID=1844999 RepID=UPI0013D33B9C|nr:hypothetical protein [Listeria sp. PSOL-1]